MIENFEKERYDRIKFPGRRSSGTIAPSGSRAVAGCNPSSLIAAESDRRWSENFSKGETTIAYRYLICLLIFLCYVLVFFHRLCPAVIALDIQSSFGISGTLLGVLSSAYFYSYAIMQLPTGLMADSWGPRKTVSVFLILAGVGSVVMGIATSNCCLNGSPHANLSSWAVPSCPWAALGRFPPALRWRGSATSSVGE